MYKPFFTRALVMAAVLSVVSGVAAPAFAIDNGSSCFICRTYDPQENTQYCGDPRSNDWGYEDCYLSWWAGCIAEGDLCYYTEVRPR